MEHIENQTEKLWCKQHEFEGMNEWMNGWVNKQITNWRICTDKFLLPIKEDDTFFWRIAFDLKKNLSINQPCAFLFQDFSANNERYELVQFTCWTIVQCFFILTHQFCYKSLLIICSLFHWGIYLFSVSHWSQQCFINLFYRAGVPKLFL